MIATALLVVGLAALVGGADLLVRAGSALASAAELKKERLEAARSDGSGPALPAPQVTSKPASGARVAKKTTGGVKKDASSRSMGARRQARRDARRSG